MFFQNISEIESIAEKVGTSIFVSPEHLSVKIHGALILEPAEKSVITIEQVREITASLGLKQTSERFVIIRPAEKLGLEAANALLKNLEEPGEKVHYVLITAEPALIPATIRSRAAIYFLAPNPEDFLTVFAKEKTKTAAKNLIAARPAELIAFADKMQKKSSTGGRAEVLEILKTAILMLEKSYFLTEKPVFLEKLPKFLQAYEAISQNGHLKLQLVANLC